MLDPNRDREGAASCRPAMLDPNRDREGAVYSEREYVANFAFVKQGVIDRAGEPPTDFILVRSDGPANKPLRDHADWKILYEDDTARLFGRVTPLIEGSRYAMITSPIPIAAGYFP